jgi:hypothetical protein
MLKVVVLVSNRELDTFERQLSREVCHSDVGFALIQFTRLTVIASDREIRMHESKPNMKSVDIPFQNNTVVQVLMPISIHLNDNSGSSVVMMVYYELVRIEWLIWSGFGSKLDHMHHLVSGQILVVKYLLGRI